MASMSLMEVFAALEDPRDASGRRHPLAALLAHAAVAILAGARSLEAVAQFGRDRGPAFAAAMGYPRERTPCKATFHNVLKALGADAFERALGGWLARRRAAGWERVSLDGKTLRGAAGEGLPGVHLLAAYAHEAKAAVAQMRVGAKTNEHKAALDLLGVLDLGGKVVIGDAAFCQRDLSREVVAKKGTTSGRSRATSPASRRRSSAARRG